MKAVSSRGELILFTVEQHEQLVSNGKRFSSFVDAVPCVYLRGRRADFLLSAIVEDFAQGLIRRKPMLLPEVAQISLEDLKRHHDIDFLFNDLTFETNYKLSVFQGVAKEIGRLVINDVLFEEHFKKHDIQP